MYMNTCTCIYRLQEQELLNYKEKEELKSSLEIIMEEKAKLLKVNKYIIIF